MNCPVLTVKEIDCPVLTVKEVSSLMRISPSKTYQLIKAGILPHISIGKRRLVPRQQLMRLLEQTAERGGSL